MKTFKEFLIEIYSKTKSTVYIDHKTKDGNFDTGADVQHANSKIIKNVPMKKILPNEPAYKKVRLPGSKQVFDSLVKSIKSQKRSEIPPITLVKHPDIKGHYMVADGHHRYQAHLKAGSRTIRAEITDPNKTEFKT